MGYIGYRVEDGRAFVDEVESQQVRDVYEGYLSGLSYEGAAKKAGLHMHQTSVKRMLQNKHYLGDGFYPAIIDRKTFDAAEEERLRRCAALGRGKRPKKEKRQRIIPTHFKMGECVKEFDDPYEQAAYIYSLINQL